MSAVGKSPCVSAKIVVWLNVILRERFGVPLVLRVDRACAWTILLSGAEDSQCIVIDAETRLLECGSTLEGVSRWDGACEGWAPALGSPIPAPGVRALPNPLVERTGYGYIIHYDVLGLVYWALTRLEEVGHAELDGHGRFAAAASHALRHGYLERPVVDEWLDILGQVIQRTWPGARLKQQRFSMQVSHDVDAPSRYGFCSWTAFSRAIVADILKYRDPRCLAAPWVRRAARSRLHVMDAFNTFDWLMNVSERHGLMSAFYFIADRRGTAHDSDYDLEHPAIRRLIRHIHEREHEIGLHPSYDTYLEPDQLRSEAERLRGVCAEEGVRQSRWGGRMHYLQWRQPVTLRAWNDAGMAYDSTMGYADHAGFRCGTCFEFPAFDPVAQEALQLRVRPLIVMEGSVLGEKYMGMGVTDAARDRMLALKQACRRVNGSFTLLWHNSSLQTSAQRRMYEAVVGG